MTQIATIILISLLLLGGYGPSLAAPNERTEYGWLNWLLKNEPYMDDFFRGYGRGFVNGLSAGAASTPSEQEKYLQCLRERNFSPDELEVLAAKFLYTRGDLFDHVKSVTEKEAHDALAIIYWRTIKDTCQVDSIYP